MNNYIMKKVSVNGTEVDFLKAIKSFFTTNSVIPFTLESENLTNTEGEQNYIRLINDDYILEFISPITTNTSIAALRINIYKNIDRVSVLASQNITYSSQTTTRDSVSSKVFPVFLVKGENIEFIFIGNYNASYGKGSGLYYIKSATSETGFIKAFSNSQSSPFDYNDYETSGIHYNIAPYHTTSTAIDTLIMDSELALKTKDNNYYCGTLIDCYGLGGGAKGMFYKDANDTLLYCFETNACFKLENKVEF